MTSASIDLDPAYVLRFTARMQERAASAREADGMDASALRHEARRLRVEASRASQGVPPR